MYEIGIRHGGERCAALLAAAALLAPLCGCTTLMDQQRETVETDTALQRIESEMARMKERVSASTAADESARQQAESWRSAQDERIRQLDDRISKLERALQTAESARQTDRKEIVNQLTTKITGIVGGESRRGAGKQTGVEHVVKQGETLSAIASAYGVSMSALVKANGLKSADSIRVGQKLFIPD